MGVHTLLVLSAWLKPGENLPMTTAPTWIRVNSRTIVPSLLTLRTPKNIEIIFS